MPTTDGTWRAGLSRGAARRWPAAEALAASACLFAALALLLVVRRVMGALTEPLPTLPLVATVVLTLALVWSMRAIAARVWADKSARWLVEWAPLVAMLLVAVACSYPGNQWLDWVVWVPALAIAFLAPRNRKRVRATVAGKLRSPVNQEPGPRGAPAIVGDEAPGQLLQQLTRVRLAHGREAVHGVLLAEFATGQENTTLYVGFCPPFERLPLVEAEVADGPSATVKTVQVLHNGARLDVHLACPAAEAARVSIEFLASEGEE